MSKMTRQDLEVMEVERWIDTIACGSLPLSDRFLGGSVKRLLNLIPQHERKWALESCLTQAINDDGTRNYSFPGIVWHDKNDAILLDIGEIEVAFEGKPEDMFDQDLLSGIYIPDEYLDPDYPEDDQKLAYFYEGYLVLYPNMYDLEEFVLETYRNYNRIELYDSHHGQYIPQLFYREQDFEKFGLDKEDYSELDNPDDEYYWDTWERLLMNSLYVGENGVEYQLEYLENDLCLIPLSLPYMKSE